MDVFKKVWRRITHTKALDQSSGELETIFYEFMYRITYITGLSSVDQNVFYLIYSYTVKMMIILMICGELWYCFDETLTLDDITACINIRVIQFIAIYRHKNMQDHKDIYRQLATSMESPHFDTTTDTRKKLVERWAKRSEKYLKLLLALGNCTLAAWVEKNIVRKPRRSRIVLVYNHPADKNRSIYFLAFEIATTFTLLIGMVINAVPALGKRYIYPLVDELEYNLIVGIRLPFEFNTPSRYPYVYILIMVAFHYIAHFVIVTDLTMQAHLIHLLCQFDVLGDCFENVLIDCQKGFEGIPLDNLVLNTKFADAYIKRLGKLVTQHKVILGYTMNLKNTLNRPMLVQLACSGTLICFIGYQTTMSITVSVMKFLMSLLFLGYNMFLFYNICLWCEEITMQGSKIGDAIYCSGWECGAALIPGVRSTIMLVIARANKPLVIRAGGMYTLSLSAYSTLVKTSYSFLTVLLRFRH